MMHAEKTLLRFILLATCLAGSVSVRADDVGEADLLIVGGTESGCAAAVQAARMGVKKIILVNDIEWLGGQFSAEALMAMATLKPFWPLAPVSS